MNLPEAKSGRWGAGLTAAKMKDCQWLKPVLVAQIEFLNGRAKIICGTRSSLRCATINLHVRFGASEGREGRRTSRYAPAGLSCRQTSAAARLYLEEPRASAACP